MVEYQFSPFVQVLQRDLDEGEAEAIALALQVKAKRTLLDEREVRRVAKSLGLKVTGALGILRRAWREGELTSVHNGVKRGAVVGIPSTVLRADIGRNGAGKTTLTSAGSVLGSRPSPARPSRRRARRDGGPKSMGGWARS